MIAYSAGTTPPRGPRPGCAPHFPGKTDAGREGGAIPPQKPGWTVRIPAALDIAAIPPNYLKMLLVLERACRDRSYCWNSNASLAALYGAENSGGFRRLLAHMRRDGYIAMVPVNPDRPGDGRLGIFLLRRLDPDLPVEDRPPSREAVARLWAARERKGEPVRRPARVTPPAPPEATPLPQMGQPPLPQMRPQNNDGVSKKDERNDDAVVASSQPPDEENFPGKALGESEESFPGKAPVEDEESFPGKAPDDLGPVVARAQEHSGGADFPGKSLGDLGPVVARAQERFGGSMQTRVAEAVAVHGREWVEVVLWGVPTLRDWGGVLATLGHWKTEGGPSDRTVERAGREMAKAAPKPVVPRRPAAERPPAEILLADIRTQGFRLEIGAEGRLELIAPEMEPLDCPRPLAERLRKHYQAAVERERSEFRSRLDGLEAEVLGLMRVSSSHEQLPGEGQPGSPEGVVAAARSATSPGSG